MPTKAWQHGVWAGLNSMVLDAYAVRVVLVELVLTVATELLLFLGRLPGNRVV